MNIFVTDWDPHRSAKVLPDKHVVKMPLETCQMLSIIFSHWYYDWGDDLVKKKDGTPYSVKKGAFRNHPCTKWVAESDHNIQWLLQHGISLCEEYTYRYGKTHACEKSITLAALLYQYGCPDKHTPFARAMPDEFKYDDTIDTITAYRRYVSSKPWVKDNYLRVPVRKPSWLDYTNSLEAV